MAEVVWGSFERNTGTWCPYPGGADVEAAFQRGDPSIFLPHCFNATVHFTRREGDHHHQRTPAVGSKPAGFRSVSRGTVGEKALLYWWADTQMWRLEKPAQHGAQTQLVEIYAAVNAAGGGGPAIWQWCDLVGDALAHAKEVNWHAYSEEQSAELEAAWAAGRRSVAVVVGITTYSVSDFSGSYAVQRNQATGGARMVRRYQSGLAPPPPPQLSAGDQHALQGESCALCTEVFADTQHMPVTRTPCGHAFHHTCLQHLLRLGDQQRKCPLCRAPLAAAPDAGAPSRGVPGLPSQMPPPDVYQQRW